MSTTNMSLSLSTPLVTTGPAWANNVESNWPLLDVHDHSSGKGVKITPAGMNVNVDLTFNDNSASDLLSSKYTSQPASLGVLFQNAVYAVNGDLYFNNGTGTPVQVTSGTSVNVSGIGGITGMGSTTAAVTYNDLTKVFSFTQNAGITASLAAGPITIFENVLAAQGVTLQSPAALAGSYSLTLPTVLPGSTLPVSISATGSITTGQIITAQIADSQVTLAKLADDSVSTSKIVDGNVTTAKLANLGITTAKIADSSVTTVKLADNSVTAAKLSVPFAVGNMVGTFTTSSATAVTVAIGIGNELVASITPVATGKRVAISFNSVNGASDSFVQVNRPGGLADMVFQIFRNGSPIYTSSLQGGNADNVRLPASSYNTLDYSVSTTAGVPIIYEVKVFRGLAGNTITLTNIRMHLREI
jgi:hypothetical protein